jgi:hypothetical protein
MREKALQPHQSNPENARPGYPHVESYDELAIFGGRTGLVLPKRPFNTITPAATPSGIRLPSIPNLIHPSPAEVISPSIPHPSYRDPQPQSAYVVNDTTSRSAGLPSNWEGLHREIPESSYYGPGTTYSDPRAGPANLPGEGVMLEDRWSSFMHHYAMMGDVQPRTRY